MGLDMYLRGRRYIGYKEDELTEKIACVLGDVAAHSVKEVIIEAAYWRKANAIHRWFVDNVQDGVDDCGYYPVDRAKLTELLETCQRVVDFKYLAEGQLPTQGGFFFGSTEYDDQYYHDIEDTITLLKRALEMDPRWDFEYHSSW